MRKLLIATTSKGKLQEVRHALYGVPFEVVNLSDVPNLPHGYDVEEPAVTFEGNAIIKAMTFGHKTGLLTLADDAGLEVDALDGRPGVLTKRYALGTDQDRYQKLLDELKGLPDEKRTARFKCVIAIYDPQSDKVRTCEGLYEGRIAREPKGENGFGYDPVFFNEELNKTNAEMTVDEKNKVSHRGKALQKAKEFLEKDFANK